MQFSLEAFQEIAELPTDEFSILKKIERDRDKFIIQTEEAIEVYTYITGLRKEKNHLKEQEYDEALNIFEEVANTTGVPENKKANQFKEAAASLINQTEHGKAEFIAEQERIANNVLIYK